MGERCRLEWGRRGARTAAARGDIVVAIDVLSFSSAAVTAVARGGVVYPSSPGDDPAELARRAGAERAVGRRDVPERGRFSLSPLTFLDLAPGTRVVLPSPNGAACCLAAREAPAVLVGSLLNAVATARAAWSLAGETGGVTVIACGERWEEPDGDGPLRVAVEDYLGAGAVLAGLPGRKSPEARVCQAAFQQMRRDLARIVRECVSGRELCERGYEGDTLHAARLDRYDVVPVLRGDRLERL